MLFKSVFLGVWVYNRFWISDLSQAWGCTLLEVRGSSPLCHRHSRTICLFDEGLGVILEGIQSVAERQVLFRSGPLKSSFFTLLKTFEHVAGVFQWDGQPGKTLMAHSC